MAGVKKAGIELDRKSLADIAVSIRRRSPPSPSARRPRSRQTRAPSAPSRDALRVLSAAKLRDAASSVAPICPIWALPASLPRLLFARQSAETSLEGHPHLIESRQNEKLRLVRKLLSAQEAPRSRPGSSPSRGEDLVEAAADAGVEPVELLVAGENVLPELLGEVSTLGHAPRVIGVFRRDDLPIGERDVVLASLARGRPRQRRNAAPLRRCVRRRRVALVRRLRRSARARGRLRASAGAIFRVPLIDWDPAPEPAGRPRRARRRSARRCRLSHPADVPARLGARGPARRPCNRLLQGDDPAARARRVAERRGCRSDRALRALAPSDD